MLSLNFDPTLLTVTISLRMNISIGAGHVLDQDLLLEQRVALRQ